MTNAPIEPTEPVASTTGHTENTGTTASTEYTGNPGYAPNPAGPAGAGSPPPKPPRRGGLPGWAWALIGGGALLLIAIIVVIVIVVNSVLGAVSASGRADEPSAAPAPVATETAPADETPAPSAAPTTKPTPVAGSGTVISLDEQVDLGSPYWTFPILDGWEISVFDQEGINQATNAELGCLFTTSQNRQPPVDTTATDDRSDTNTALEFLNQQMVDSVEEAEVVGGLGSTEVAIGMGDSAGTLEFATSRVEYINPEDGGPYVNELAARVMPLSEAFLYAVVSCPASVVDAGNSPFEGMLDELAVVFE